MTSSLRRSHYSQTVKDYKSVSRSGASFLPIKSSYSDKLLLYFSFNNQLNNVDNINNVSKSIKISKQFWLHRWIGNIMIPVNPPQG